VESSCHNGATDRVSQGWSRRGIAEAVIETVIVETVLHGWAEEGCFRELGSGFAGERYHGHLHRRFQPSSTGIERVVTVNSMRRPTEPNEKHPLYPQRGVARVGLYLLLGSARRPY